MMQKQLSKGYIFIILSAIIFGLMPLMAKFIYAQGVNSVSLVFLRNILSLPILAALAIYKENGIKIDIRALPQISFIAIMGCCITPLLLFTSYNFISSGTATVFHFIYPAVVVICEIIFLKSKKNYIHIISVIICITGISLFYNSNDPINLKGSICALLSGITYAIYVISLSVFKNKKTSIFGFSLQVAAICSIIMLVICIATKQLTFPHSVFGWLLTIFFAFALNIGAVVLFQKGTFLIGGSRASILSALEPITSVLAGTLIFDEHLSIITIIGTILVIAASVLISINDIQNSAT